MFEDATKEPYCYCHFSKLLGIRTKFTISWMEQNQPKVIKLNQTIGQINEKKKIRR